MNEQALPEKPCGKCGSPRFWYGQAGGWRCAGCRPMPKNYRGETCCVSGGDRETEPTATREEVLTAYPETIPVSTDGLVGDFPHTVEVSVAQILDHADPLDMEDLLDQDTLHAFARSLLNIRELKLGE